MIDTSVGCVTVNNVDPLIELVEAVMVVMPTAAAVATPELEMVATALAVELHVAVLVKFLVLPSL